MVVLLAFWYIIALVFALTLGRFYLSNYRRFYYFKETAKVELRYKYGPNTKIIGYQVHWTPGFLRGDYIDSIVFSAITPDQEEVSILVK